MDDYSKKPLHELVINDKFYQEVLERLEDPNEKDNEGNTLLHAAARSAEDNSEIFKLLLDKGADVNSTTKFGYTPLHFAVCSRKRSAVVALIEAGASVNSKDLLERTTLHFAITGIWLCIPSPTRNIRCDMWIVERLLCHPEINLNPVDKMGETPLIWAVIERNSGAVRTLLKKGANPNIPKKDKRTPLHVALLDRNPPQNIVFSLLINGAGIYSKDRFRKTPIDILIRNITNDVALRFAKRCVYLIALRYQIRDSLKNKLETIPELSNLLNKCCNEVRLMRKFIITGKFTLYDFVLGCFDERVENPVRIIYTPLLEILLTGLFSEYYFFIFGRISLQNLRRVLERTIGSKSAENLVPNDASCFTIFDAIMESYNQNEVLKEGLLEFKEFLMKKI